MLDWLEAIGEPYDIVTDEDIDRHSLRVLQAYACALTCNGYDSGISRLTANVLRRFLAPEPL